MRGSTAFLLLAALAGLAIGVYYARRPVTQVAVVAGLGYPGSTFGAVPIATLPGPNTTALFNQSGIVHL